MANNEIPQPRDLPNKPLVEAIFELRWGLRILGPTAPPQDPGFRIALGRFYDQIRKDYPHVVDLPTAQVPEDMTAYTVRHQFRVAADSWPLMQLGPGILTVNDTVGYSWSTFRPKVLAAVNGIFDAYPADIHPFQPISIRLRYIDAIELDPQGTDPIRFLEDYLHTKVAVEPLLTGTPAKQLRMNLTFPLDVPKGTGILGFASGARDGQPNIIMEIVIRADGDDVPNVRDGFAGWVEAAHAIADKWFFTLCRGRLMETFEESHANT